MKLCYKYFTKPYNNLFLFFNHLHAPFLNNAPAYTSPFGRAKLTAELGLQEIPKFSSKCNDDNKEEGSGENSTRNNFERNVLVEEWCKELSAWRTKEDYDYQHAKGSTSGRNPAIWDFPAPIIRSKLHETNEGTESSITGWRNNCPDHLEHEIEYRKFCDNTDGLLARHGIISRPVFHEDGGRKIQKNHYYLSQEVVDNETKRLAKIAIFCHNGTGLTLLSHLLSIPPPIVYASMWLAPSSVTTILFDEYPACEIEKSLKYQHNDESSQEVFSDIIVEPKAICIGGTNHLALKGLSIPSSRYEDNERPSGIKHNFH